LLRHSETSFEAAASESREKLRKRENGKWKIEELNL